METTYLCPKCKAVLNVTGDIILSAKNSKGDCGLILLHPSIGNYQVICHQDFIIEDGEESHFRCPACYSSMKFSGDNKLAYLIMCDENNHEYKIIFSRIKGEQSTYKIQGESLDIYGKDSQKHLDIINLCKFD
jgi:hypothetical protein